jgi:putative ABC transport system permease protein
MNILGDIRQGARALRSRPGFAVMAILTLAVGLAAVSTIFSVVDTVVLRDLPYREPGRIVTITQTVPGFFGSKPSVCTLEQYLRWKQSGLAQYAAAMDTAIYTLTGEGHPERLEGASVTPDFFRVFGIQPLLGRSLRTEDAKPGRDHVVILSHQLWARRFGSDPKIAGKTVILSDIPMTVIGVMPVRFDFPRLADVASIMDWAPQQSEFWVPLTITQKVLDQGSYDYYILGRLRAGITYRRAEAQFRVIAVQILKEFAGKMPQYRAVLDKAAQTITINVNPLRETISWGVRDSLWMLLGAVGLLLILVLFNIGNLLLTRNASRLHEFAVRQALGASRWRLFLQSLIEQAVLIAVAAGLSVLLTEWCLELLRITAANRLPRLYDLGFDSRIWLVFFGLSLMTAILFGAIPLLLTGDSRLSLSLQGESRSATGDRRTNRLRSTLMVGEIAISVVLLVGAGMLMESFLRVINVNPGFDPHNLLTFTITFNPKYHSADANTLLLWKRKLLENIRAIPGIEAATEANGLPLTGEHNLHGIKAVGSLKSSFPQAEYRVVDPDFFRTLRIPLIRGRLLRTDDNVNFAVINETMAKRLWPNEDPIGRQITEGDRPPYTVIGVVGDVHNGPLEQSVDMQYYRSMKAGPGYGDTFIMRTRIDHMAVLPEVQKALWRADPDQAISHAQTMQQILEASTLSRRFQTGLLTGFAASSLLLASIGLFGITALSVLRRTREFGIRMALGAPATSVVWLELSRGLQLLIAGIVLGLAFSVFAVRALKPFLLYGCRRGARRESIRWWL